MEPYKDSGEIRDIRILNYTGKKIKLILKDDDGDVFEQLIPPTSNLFVIRDPGDLGAIRFKSMTGEVISIPVAERFIASIENIPPVQEDTVVIVRYDIAEQLDRGGRRDVCYPEIISESTSMITSSKLLVYSASEANLVMKESKSKLEQLVDDTEGINEDRS